MKDSTKQNYTNFKCFYSHTLGKLSFLPPALLVSVSNGSVSPLFWPVSSFPWQIATSVEFTLHFKVCSLASVQISSVQLCWSSWNSISFNVPKPVCSSHIPCLHTISWMSTIHCPVCFKAAYSRSGGTNLPSNLMGSQLISSEIANTDEFIFRPQNISEDLYSCSVCVSPVTPEPSPIIKDCLDTGLKKPTCAFKHADAVKMTHWRSNQASEWGRKGFFRNCWSTGIFTY